MQRDIILNIHSDLDSSIPTQTTETVTYIADLLGELQTIARIAGLTVLSNDLESVLTKHSAKPDYF